MARKLTKKQQMFVKEYLVDLNATQAAVRAGYSKKSAMEQSYQLIRNPSVSAAIQTEMDKRSKKTDIKAEYILETIKETIDRCRQAKPVTDKQGNLVMTETEDGIIVPAYRFDANGILRGCELLGKHLKLFNDNKEGSVTISIDLESRRVRADIDISDS